MKNEVRFADVSLTFDYTSINLQDISSEKQRQISINRHHLIDILQYFLEIGKLSYLLCH